MWTFFGSRVVLGDIRVVDPKRVCLMEAPFCQRVYTMMSRKRFWVRCKLVLFANRKSYGVFIDTEIDLE